jgi:hypothetical protein
MSFGPQSKRHERGPSANEVMVCYHRPPVPSGRLNRIALCGACFAHRLRGVTAIPPRIRKTVWHGTMT